MTAELALDAAVIALTISIVAGMVMLSAQTGLAVQLVGGLLLYGASVLLSLKLVTSPSVRTPPSRHS